MSLIFLSLVASSCGGSGEGLDVNGRPLSESNNSVNDVNEPSDSSGSDVFSLIQRDVLDVSCATSGCHSGTSAPLGLNLDAGKAYAMLVNQPSLQVSGLLLVEPSNPDASYLVSKLEGRQEGGLQMPLGKPPIDSQQLAMVRQWILDGAVESKTNSATTDEPTESVSTNEEETVLADLDDIQSKIFDTKCTSCHSGSAPSADLNLEPAYSYSQLVERASSIDPQAKPLVSIGNPQNSFLVDKLRGNSLGTPNTSDYRGARMPIVGDDLTEQQLQAIEQWITDGATEVSAL